MTYQVDLTIFPKPLIHYKFRQIQQLAINKGFLWEYSGHKILRKYHTSSFIDWHFTLDFDRLIISIDYKHPIITYKEAIQKLKALQLLKEYKPYEARKIDQRTVQDTNATTTATSYTIPTSLIGGTMFATWSREPIIYPDNTGDQ